MSTGTNPIEPDIDATYRAERREATRALLVETIVNETQPRGSSRRNVAVAGAVGALMAGGATFAYAHFSDPAPVTDRESARCYTEVSTEFGDDFPGLAVVAPEVETADGRPVVSEIGDPIQSCRYLWTSGLLRLGTLEARPLPGANEAPPLVECVLPDGTAAVFPGDPTTCANLGIPAAER